MSDDSMQKVIEEMDISSGESVGPRTVRDWRDRLAAQQLQSAQAEVEGRQALLDHIERVAERVDNFLAATNIPMDASFHLRALRAALPAIASDLRSVLPPSDDA